MSSNSSDSNIVNIFDILEKDESKYEYSFVGNKIYGVENSIRKILKKHIKGKNQGLNTNEFEPDVYSKVCLEAGEEMNDTLKKRKSIWKPSENYREAIKNYFKENIENKTYDSLLFFLAPLHFDQVVAFERDNQNTRTNEYFKVYKDSNYNISFIEYENSKTGWHGIVELYFCTFEEANKIVEEAKITKNGFLKCCDYISKLFSIQYSLKLPRYFIASHLYNSIYNVEEERPFYWKHGWIYTVNVALGHRTRSNTWANYIFAIVEPKKIDASDTSDEIKEETMTLNLTLTTENDKDLFKKLKKILENNETTTIDLVTKTFIELVN